MLATAKNKYVRISPYKLRPIANVIRGLPVERALAWLKTHRFKRTIPITKTLLSAVANIKNIGNRTNEQEQDTPINLLFIKDIRIDQSLTVTYFKAGAMGRSNIRRKRMSHIAIVLDKKMENSHKNPQKRSNKNEKI